MVKYGSIRARIQYTWVGHAYDKRWVDFTWEGPPVALVHWNLIETFSTGRVLLPDEELQIGPFRLRVIRYDIETNSYVMRRLDQHALASWLMMWRFWVQQELGRLGKQLVLTLAIWGLADWPTGGEVPGFDLVRRKWRRQNHE